MLYLYTDGSSTGRRDREWGWAFIVSLGEEGCETGVYGGGDKGTNNVAELTAAIKGLEYVKFCKLHNKYIDEKITLISDSLYVLKTASGEYTPKKNLELCVRLRDLFIEMDCEGKWVKGHSGNRFNDLADKYSKMGKTLYAPKKV